MIPTRRLSFGAAIFALAALLPLSGGSGVPSQKGTALQATSVPTASATADSGALTVQADQTIGSISPFVYGVNDGPWALVPDNLQALSGQVGATYLRYPAGNWGDQHDLQPFLVDLFIASARQRHAEPTISVRLKGGTPDDAAALVQYTNIQQKYGVHYWSIGNEPDLYPNYTVDQYVRDWRAMAVAMRAVDPSILFVGPDISQYPATADAYGQKFRDWLSAFLKADGDLVSIVSIHRYPFPAAMNAPATTIDQLRQNPAEWDTIIPDLRQVIKAALGHDLPVGVTEVNSHWSPAKGGPADPDSFFHAIWWADALGHLIRQQVAVVAYFTLYTGATDASGLIGPSGVRPTYYVYSLYQHLGNQLLGSASTDASVTITAARRADGALTLLVINPADQDKALPISISGQAITGAVTLWRLDASHNAQSLGTTDEISKGTLHLPAQSASLYVISAP